MTAATWGCRPALRRPGELLTRGDVCHVHADRAAAERCGVLLGGAPELVRLDEVRTRGLPRGVVAAERRERPATLPPPGSRQARPRAGPRTEPVTLYRYVGPQSQLR